MVYSLDIAREIKGFNPELNVNQASMPPASWFSHKDFYTLDRDKIFNKTWQPVARIEEINKPNSYKAGCISGLPWVICSDKNGTLKAFHNICSHKGREVVTGTGKAPDGRIACGYHGWLYGTDGELKRIPRQDSSLENFNKLEHGLKPMALEVWGHWVFINPDPSASSLNQSLKELTKRLESRQWMNLKFHSHKSWDIACNWKVYVDNYLDGGYHIPHMHPSLNQQLDMSSYKTELFDSYSIQSSPPTKKDQEVQGVSAQARIGQGSIYAWMFPNFMINLYGDCLDINWVIPISESSCRVYYEFYFLSLNDKDFIASSIKQSDITQVEDIEICESVQVGMNSGHYTPGRYVPNIEQGEHHFHKLLSQYYQ